MVADVYSHIIDEDRCINAQRLEEAFYSSKTPDPVEDTEPKNCGYLPSLKVMKVMQRRYWNCLKNPETAALLKQLAKSFIKSLPQKNASHFVRGFLRLNHFAQ